MDTPPSDSLDSVLQHLLDLPLADALAALGHVGPVPVPPDDIASVRALLHHPTPPMDLLDAVFLASQQSTTVSRSIADVMQLAALSVAITRCAFEVPSLEQPMFRDLFEVASRLDWVDEATKEILDDGLTALTHTDRPAAIATPATTESAPHQVDTQSEPARPKWRINLRSAFAATFLLAVIAAIPLYYHQQTAGDGPRFEGWIESAGSRKITGWAWDSSRPGKPVEVELSDGVHPAMTIVADRNRADLGFIGEGHANHGFEFDIPAEFRDGKTYTVTAKIVGTDYTLNASPATVAYAK